MSEVILYTSEEVGAPASSNAAGGIISILDACLANGFNAHSVVSLTVAGGVATATVSAHGYLVGRKLLIAGAGTSSINGVKTITSAPSSNTLTFAAPGVGDGAIAGTITCKRAPLGWTKAFGDSTHGMYERTDSGAPAALLRVDDSGGGTVARVFGVESATGNNTYVNKFPTEVQFPGGGYWQRPASPSVGWVLVGDGLTFYLFTQYGSDLSAMAAHAFGKVDSFRPGDPFSTFLGYGFTAATPTFMQGVFSLPTGIGSQSMSMQRDFQGLSIGAPTNFFPRGGSPMGGVVQLPLFPSPVDNGLVLEPRVLAFENTFYGTPPIRGIIPGIAEPMAQFSASAHLSQVSNGSKQYLIVRLASGGGGAPIGAVAIDVTGPWQ